VLAITGWKESYRFIIIMFAEVSRTDKKCTFEILNEDVRHGGRCGEVAS